MNEKLLKIDNVTRYLPHRKPFIFVDQAEVNGDLSKIWTKHTFLPEEPYFEGHFPGDPIVPGVVLLECLAQSARLLLNFREDRIVPGYLVGVESAKFNLVVRPYQAVLLEAQLVKETGELAIDGLCGRISSFRSAGYVDDQRCVRASINLYQFQSPGALPAR